MVKCESQNCNHAAVATVYWPGSAPLRMCHSCGLRATGVAHAMSFRLTVEALEVVPGPSACLTREQLFGA